MENLTEPTEKILESIVNPAKYGVPTYHSKMGEPFRIRDKDLDARHLNGFYNGLEIEDDARELDYLASLQELIHEGYVGISIGQNGNPDRVDVIYFAKDKGAKYFGKNKIPN